MEDGKKYVAFLRSYYDAMQELPHKARAELALAIVEYGFEGKVESISGTAKAVFLAIKPTLDLSTKNSTNIRKRWNKYRETADAKPTVSYDTPNDTANKNGTVPLSLIRERERERDREGDNPPIVPPTGDEGVEKEDPLFAEFWTAYPKKVGKGAAKRAFLKLPRKTQRLLLPALQKQKQSEQWTKDNGRYIPNALTWINQGRWEDELDSVSDVPQTTNPFLRLMMEEAENE